LPISNSQNPFAEVVPAPLKAIDWSKLRRQKKYLLTRLEKNKGSNGASSYEKGVLTGLLHLLDNIQEYAVEELKQDPAAVWGAEAMDVEEAA
jgi:hypothetical protein